MYRMVSKIKMQLALSENSLGGSHVSGLRLEGSGTEQKKVENILHISLGLSEEAPSKRIVLGKLVLLYLFAMYDQK